MPSHLVHGLLTCSFRSLAAYGGLTVRLPAVPRASFTSLGCRLNHTEAANWAGHFAGKGYTIVPWGDPADLVVINTCSVTHRAEAHCRNTVRRTLRHSPEAFVVVAGCYAQSGLDALRGIAGVDMIVGTEFKESFPDYLDRPRKLPEPVVLHSARISRHEFEVPSTGRYDSTRANLKVQDGCDFFCSFCIIPYTRGRERSRRFDDLVREARELAEAGYQELVLTGVNIGRYQSGGRTLTDVADRLEEVPGLRRIRITSIEPTTVEDRLLERMAQRGTLCRYLHLPVQSGDDEVLSRMGRRYRMRDYREFADRAVEMVPGLGLGTDVIVGFPGETDDAFRRTCDNLEEMPFAYYHVFSYSSRAGTRAAGLAGHLPPDLVAQRSRTLRELSDRRRDAFARRHLGQRVEVLFEQQDRSGRWTGLTDSYLRVGVVSAEPLENCIREVRITRIASETPGLAVGTLLPAGG